MTSRCAGEPVSWIRLERYHLGEVQGAEARAIAEHLAACPACRACLIHIETDATVLPQLDVSARRGAVGGGRPSPIRRRATLARAITAAMALAAAAAMLLALRGKDREGPVSAMAEGFSRTKGTAGEVAAFALVREDGEHVVGDVGVYRDGDRFKAVVTCSPGFDAAFDLVVFDAGGASFPLEPARGLACGNDVPLPGALRLTGHAVETVCLVWDRGETAPRSALAKGAGSLGERALCKRLDPAPAR